MSDKRRRTVTEIFFITQRLMIYLMAFILLGYGLCYFRLMHAIAQKFLSDLVATVLIAILVFNAIHAYFTIEKLKASFQFAGLFLVGTILMMIPCYWFSKKMGQPGNQCGSFLISCILINVGYIGLAVLQALQLGPSSFIYFSVATFLMNVTLGCFSKPFIRRMSREKGEENDPFRLSIISPSMVGLLLGLVVYSLKLTLPPILLQGLAVVGKAGAPLAMVVIGCNLYSCALREIFFDWKLYVICLLKLLVLPLVALFLSALVVRDTTMLITFAILMGCPPLAILPIYTERSGGDGKWCTRYVFLCTLLSVVTLPLVVLIAGNVAAIFTA